MEINEFVKRYNLINLVLALCFIVVLLLFISNTTLINFVGSILIIGCIIFFYEQNKARLKAFIKSKRRQLIINNGIDLVNESSNEATVDYLLSVLPKPINLPDIAVNHTVIATSQDDNGINYQIDLLEYEGHFEGSHGKVKKFDMTSYIITVDFEQNQFCNRPLLYFNSHNDISRYRFPQNHQLVFRGSSNSKVMNARIYIHNRLLGYNGFHDKYVKNVVQIIDFNPYLFKKKFCKAAIFDGSKLYYFVDDNLLDDLRLEYNYTNREVSDLIDLYKNQVEVLKEYITSLSTINDGVVRTKGLK